MQADFQPQLCNIKEVTDMADAKSTKPVVVWIENKMERELHEDLKKWLSPKGVELCHVTNVDKLAEKLDDLRPVGMALIRGFIVDMMLDGPKNLSSFGMPSIMWDHDIHDAGSILLDHVLKEKDSSYIDIPTLVLSVRPDLDETQIMAYPNTTLVIKRDIANLDWHKNLKKWVDDL